MKLDKKNCMILDLLQKDCRMSLTKIGVKVDLSVDSVKKRINRMKENKIFYSKIQLRPRNFGFQNVVDIKIKFHNHTMQLFNKFVDTMYANPHVIEMFSVAGVWDFSIIVIAKDAHHLGEMSSSIRTEFSELIQDWSESLTTRAYKFEKYDMMKINEEIK
jgi:Lrp/AsnC family transcriptional regulator